MQVMSRIISCLAAVVANQQPPGLKTTVDYFMIIENPVDTGVYSRRLCG